MYFVNELKKRKKTENITNVIIWILLILSPFILLGIQSLINGVNLFRAVPIWSDELDYWREMYSFSGNGFDFGGSLYVGMEAPIGPMGAHSVSPVAAWGMASLFSWGRTSILWSNLILLSVSWLLLVIIACPNFKKSICALSLSFLYPAIFLYLHSSMIEMVVFAGIIVFFALLSRFEKEGGNLIFALLLVCGLWLMALRITYVVLLFPVLWKKCGYKVNLKTIITMIVYAGAFLGLYKVYNLFCAGYPGWTTKKLADAGGIRQKLGVLLVNVKENLYRLLSPHSADAVQVGERYLLLLLMLLLLLFSFVRYDSFIKKVIFKFRGENLSLFLMVGALLAAMVALYDIKDWRDYRTFAPIVFGILVLLVLRVTDKKVDELRVAFTYAVVFVLFIGLLLSKVNFIKEKESIAQAVGDYSTLGKYLSETDLDGNPKTIATSPDLNWLTIEYCEALPSKLGMQVFYEDINESNVKLADYVFVSYDYYENRLAEIDLEMITEISGVGIIFDTGKGN